jgi:hypothetical protein
MPDVPLCRPWEHRVSRRRVLGSLAAGVLAGGGAGAALSAHRAMADGVAPRNDKQTLLIWLDGGMSQLESWDPKPNTEFGGPFRAIDTSVPGVRVSELLRHTARQMHHLALLRSVSTQDNSHSAGVARINRGDPKNRGVEYPYLGSAVAKLLGPTSSGMPPYVWIKPYGGGFKAADAGFLGAKYGALALGDGKPPENLLPAPSVRTDELELRDELRARFNRRYAAGRPARNVEADSHVYDLARTLMKRADLFDDSTFSDRDRERYGTHELGRHLLLARRTLEAGVRFVKVNSYHWDSHGDNFNACDSLIPQFDRPFAALIEDLHERGMLDNVLVIVMSEFGRTPKINSHVGRDHWPEAWSIAMAGTGLRRGVVVGKTNDEGTFVDGKSHDIGDLFHTWFRALGVPPERMEYDNQGQPLPVAHEGCAVIGELLA